MRKPNLSTPVISLCVFLLIAQIANATYFAFGAEPSGAFELLSMFGFFWLMGGWITDDNKQHGVKWVYDLGFFLYLAWIFIIPFYLFKTRGLKAFITVFYFIGIFLGTYLIGLATWLVITWWIAPTA